MKEYFSHDYDALTDRNGRKMKRKLGMVGIGIYWELVQFLHKEEDHTILIDELADLAYQLKVDEDVLRSLVFDFELFNFDEEKIWINRVLKNLAERNRKREINKKNGMRGGRPREEQNPVGLRKDTETLPKKTKVKEKEKESKIKENNNKLNSSVCVAENFAGNSHTDFSDDLENEISWEKKKFGEFVRLDFREEQDLRKRCEFDEELFAEIIEELNLAIGSASPEVVKAKYSNHFFAFQRFLRAKKDRQQNSAKNWEDAEKKRQAERMKKEKAYRKELAEAEKAKQKSREKMRSP